MKLLSFVIRLFPAVATIVAVLAVPLGAFASVARSPSAEQIEAGSTRLSLDEAGASAIPVTRKVTVDARSERLEAYLASHNSPLTPYSYVFVEKADKYGLDWRLVASISGVESTFGKRIPVNSYNAYGWNGGNFYFKSWEDGIDTVSKTLREKYADKWGADTVWEIAPYYAPPSKTWARNVVFFMEQIEHGPKTKSTTLALRLTI